MAETAAPTESESAARAGAGAERASTQRRIAIGVLIVAGLLLAWTRIEGVARGLWHDEAYTVLNYIGPGPKEILFGEYVPNDHALYNLLTWATTNLLDDYTDSVYRLWSALPALGAVALLGWWLWRRVGPWTAVAFSLLVLTSPLHLDLAPQARGYGLTFLAIALTVVCADAVIRGGGRWSWVGFAAGGVIGSFTLPVFGLAFVGVAIAVAIARRDLWRECAAWTAGTGALILLLYAPVLGDILGRADQRFGEQLAWHATVTYPVDELLGPSAELLLREVPQALGELALAALVLLGAARFVRFGELRLAVLLAVPVLFVHLALTLGRFYVAPRFTSYLVLPLLALAAAALAAPLEVALRSARVRAASAAVAVVALGALTLVGSARVIEDADADAELPFENFEAVGELADRAEIPRVVTNSIRPEGLWYYLGGDRVTVLSGEALEFAVCGGDAPFLYVDHPLAVPGEAPTQLQTDCLEERGATRFRIPQQPERGDALNVWLVTGPPPFADDGEVGRRRAPPG